MISRIDDIDRKILGYLQENARQTAEQLSEKVDLSPAACQRRMKRLRDEGFIDKEIAILSGKATGGHMTFIVQVSLSNHLAGRADLFRRQVLGFGDVQQCFHVTGEFDFVLVITACDMTHFEDITNRLLRGNDCVARFLTTVSYGTIKQSLHVPVRQER